MSEKIDENEEIIAYLKYSGEYVEYGLLDIQKSAEALLGFNEILRYFLLKEAPVLKDVKFEIPVRVKKGSWEVIIPEIAEKVFSPTGLSITTLGIYLGAAAKKAAEDGFGETGMSKDAKSLLKATVKSAQWVIKIAVHLGTLSKRKFEHSKIDMTKSEIQIENDSGEYLTVPKKYLDLYLGCPESLFSKNATLVEEGRILEIGVVESGKREGVIVKKEQKTIFSTLTEDEEILFPELIDGEYVELIGEVTRGNEKANSLGFEYMGHVLTCKPKVGNIVAYKDSLFSRQVDHLFSTSLKIGGVIDRTDDKGGFKNKRPIIIFETIELLESDGEANLSLF